MERNNFERYFVGWLGEDEAKRFLIETQTWKPEEIAIIEEDYTSVIWQRMFSGLEMYEVCRKHDK